eukprot:GHVS01107181.1.p1 GENE.GHVS01107181.1~~GHVS01107181.1.p1  ORF type:complete len:179 (-),score=2.40 GHVS01107181.1:208-744(-)
MPIVLKDYHLSSLFSFSSTVGISSEYAYCVLDILLCYLLMMFLTFNVVRARKRFGVDYPDLYATKGVTHRSAPEDEFTIDSRPLLLSDADCDHYNCYQRAHQNTLELFPAVASSILLGGLAHPIWAAAGGLIWIISRICHALGYYTGKPINRIWGIYGYVGLIVTICKFVHFFELVLI